MSELKVKDSNETITVQNVYCIGKNYLEHIKEFDKQKQSEIPEEPIIFLKPNTSVVCNANTIAVPSFKGGKISENLQNEVELVIIIGKDGENIPVADAFDYVFGYSVGIDFTLRDIQSDFKKKGLPWTLSKGFIGSAPVSYIVKKENIKDPSSLALSLKINEEVKQSSNTGEMIFKIPYLIYYISCLFGLRRGDIIFSGTPAGVTKLNPWDKINACIENIGELNIEVI